jgi:hypothetical protein
MSRIHRDENRSPTHPSDESHLMLYTIAIILLALWILGFVTGTTIGGLIHLLLVIAVLIILVRLFTGWRSIE